MIQANQLRLGNYLFNRCNDHDTIVKVTSLDDHQIGCGIQGVKVNLCYKFENYKPIPLNAGILENFPQVKPLKIESSNGFFYYTGSGQFVRLDFLHQLQNLYFTIKNEELPLDFEFIAATITKVAANAGL